MFFFFSFRYNQFTGTIDFSILPNSLQLVAVYGNNFHGNVGKFGHLTDLIYFYVYSNNLNGTIDWTQFENLNKLTNIRFHDNKLTGNIDLSYFDFNQLSLCCLYGYDNLFDGTINLGTMGSTVEEVYFYNNPYIEGGIDFSGITSTSTLYPRIWLDEEIYCDASVYCRNLTCAVAQDRTNPSSGYCGGKANCENTCGLCVDVECPTLHPTIIPTLYPIATGTTDDPTIIPTIFPTVYPSVYPSKFSSIIATERPFSTKNPTSYPTTHVHTTHTIHYLTPSIDTQTSSTSGSLGSTNGHDSSGTKSGAASNNLLSDSHITLLIICGLIAVLFIVIGCSFCFVFYIKHSERFKTNQMTEIVEIKQIVTSMQKQRLAHSSSNLNSAINKKNIKPAANVNVNVKADVGETGNEYDETESEDEKSMILMYGNGAHDNDTMQI